MMHPTRAGIGLIRLGHSDFVSANPEDDVRGREAYDTEGQRIGVVEDLYVDRRERERSHRRRVQGGLAAARWFVDSHRLSF